MSKFIESLDVCEFERYAPGDPAGNMNTTFETAMNAITEIENDVKSGKKSGRKAMAFSVMLMLFFIPSAISAMTKDQADEAYKKELKKKKKG